MQAINGMLQLLALGAGVLIFTNSYERVCFEQWLQ